MRALTPLVTEARSLRSWIKCTAVYTTAGALSSIVTGLAIGAAGRALLRGPNPSFLLLPAGLSVLLALRELELLQFRLPESRRQTERNWPQMFGPLTGVAMWGLHIGFGYSTRLGHGGPIALGVAVFALADPTAGSMIMASYWIGRSMSVWLAPWIMPAHWLSGRPGCKIPFDRTLNRRLSAFGLVWTAAAAAAWTHLAGGQR